MNEKRRNPGEPVDVVEDPGISEEAVVGPVVKDEGRPFDARARILPPRIRGGTGRRRCVLRDRATLRLGARPIREGTPGEGPA